MHIATKEQTAGAYGRDDSDTLVPCAENTLGSSFERGDILGTKTKKKEAGAGSRWGLALQWGVTESC